MYLFDVFLEQVDVPYQYLTFFMEDDEELKRIGEEAAIVTCFL